MLKIEIEGIAKLESVLSRLTPETLEAAGVGLHNEAERIMTRSKEEFVPVKTGALRSTGHVGEVEVKSNEVVVEMGYGGPGTPYAVAQHERLDYQHPGQGEAKYLERPTLEAVHGMGSRIAADVAKELKR